MAVAPLLSFPPSPSPSPSLSHDRPNTVHFPLFRTTHSTFSRIISALPLLLIFSLLSFAFYAFFITLVCQYLIYQRAEYLRATVYSLVFWLLWGGCSGSVTMAVWRGGGRVGEITKGTGRDEESQVGGEEGVGLLRDDDHDLDDYEDVGRSARAEGREILTLTTAEGITSTLYPSSRSLDLDTNQEAHDLKKKDRSSFSHRDDVGRWNGDEEQSRQNSNHQTKSNGEARWCKKCRIFKPDRAHHCSSCGYCVLKMDHHCPWLGGGCVGYANYKFFLLFLWYGSALGIYVGLVAMFELGRFVEAGPDNFELAPIAWALLVLLGLIFGIALFFFGAYHFYLACNNLSTIESIEHSTSYALPASSSHSPRSNHTHTQLRSPYALTRQERRKLEKAARKLHIYDLGWRKNLGEVFGGGRRVKGRWWEWGLPMGRSPGDGTSFPIDRSKLAQLQKIIKEIRSVDSSEESEESS